MQIDPQAELILKLTDDGKAYSFRPWSYRQQRNYQSWSNDQDIVLSDYSDRVFDAVKETYNGNADDLLDMTFVDLMKLLGKLYNACFVSPDDKKKSES